MPRDQFENVAGFLFLAPMVITAIPAGQLTRIPVIGGLLAFLWFCVSLPLSAGLCSAVGCVLAPVLFLKALYDMFSRR